MQLLLLEYTVCGFCENTVLLFILPGKGRKVFVEETVVGTNKICMLCVVRVLAYLL